MKPIQGIQISSPQFASPISRAQPMDGQPSFKEFMLEAIDHVNSMQQNADNAVETLMTGGDISAAEVQAAVQKSDLTFRTMMQIRDSLVQAYEEIKEIRI
jgi:flagellar hook-basal body complex protein FliE